MLNAIWKPKAEAVLTFFLEIMFAGHVVRDYDLRKEIKILVNMFCFPAYYLRKSTVTVGRLRYLWAKMYKTVKNLNPFFMTEACKLCKITMRTCKIAN